MNFEDPLLTGLGISIDFLIVFLLDELVPIIVQCSNDGTNRGRGWYRCDDGCPASRDEYSIPQSRYCRDEETAKSNTSAVSP
jgi:hypothetical protein